MHGRVKVTSNSDVDNLHHPRNSRYNSDSLRPSKAYNDMLNKRTRNFVKTLPLVLLSWDVSDVERSAASTIRRKCHLWRRSYSDRGVKEVDDFWTRANSYDLKGLVIV